MARGAAQDSGGDASSSDAGEAAAAQLSVPVQLDIKQADALYRKLYRKIIPPCFLVVFFCYVDRTNLGLAASDFCSDNGLGHDEYGTGVAVFFLGYSVFQIPSNLMLERVGAPKWLGLLVVVWGAAAASMAFVTTPAGFYFVRFLLGVAEAGTFPAIWSYFTLFFPENRITVPIALNEVGVVISQVVSAPIAAGFLSLEGTWGLHGWQWLFFVESVPPIALGIMVYLTLPKTPVQAEFLTSAEREWLLSEIKRNRPAKVSGSAMVTVWMQLKDCVVNFQLWLVTAVKFLRDLSAYSTIFYASLLIETMLVNGNLTAQSANPGKKPSCAASEGGGHHTSTVEVALLTTVPFTLASVAGLLNSWHAERTGEKRYHIAITYWTAGIVFGLLPVFINWGFFFGFVGLIAGVVGSQGATATLTSLAVSVSSPENKAVGLAFYNSFSNIGGFLAPFTIGHVVDSEKDYTHAVVCLALTLFSAGFVAILVRDPHREIYLRLMKSEVEADDEEAGMLPGESKHPRIQAFDGVVRPESRCKERR